MEPTTENRPCDLSADLLKWGDRTSSLMTAYPGFKDFRCGGLAGRIRYASLKSSRLRQAAWVGATEPISPEGDRRAFVKAFFQQAEEKGVCAFLMPVSAQLVGQLTGEAHALCVGAEPVFSLDEERWGGGLDEFLRAFPRARSLLKRGFRVEVSAGSDLSVEAASEIEGIEQAWRRTLRGAPLGFLNQVSLKQWSDTPEKRFFLLREPRSGKLQACLTALRVPGAGAWYFAEVLRDEASVSGAMPLLMFGAMDLLRQEGAREVRLGMAPLGYDSLSGEERGKAFASLEASLAGRLLLFLSRRDTQVYGFRSAWEFKRRLRPSRWDPLYLLSKERPSLRLLLQVADVHFPQEGALRTLLRILRGKLEAKVDTKLKPLLSESFLKTHSGRPWHLPVLVPLTAAVLLVLHSWKSGSSALASAFSAQAYVPGSRSWGGWFFGPLSHNHAYHLWGDVLSYGAFGMVLERLAGGRFLTLVLAVGLWLSNPVTEVFVRLVNALGGIPSDAWSNFLGEQDRGSSNAVYAFVGALAAFSRRRFSLWLLLPFVANGFYLCWVRGSWLSLHHWVGLLSGWILARSWLAWETRKQLLSKEL
jgi:hypothetical protein